MEIDQVLWIPGELHLQDTVTNGKSSVKKIPVDEFLKNVPGCILISFDDFLTKQAEIEAANFLTPWKEIDRDKWTEMLEILPPEKWKKTGIDSEAFRLMEYFTGNITDHYFSIGKRYFTAPRRTSQNYSEMLEDIKKQFSF